MMKDRELFAKRGRVYVATEFDVIDRARNDIIADLNVDQEKRLLHEKFL